MMHAAVLVPFWAPCSGHSSISGHVHAPPAVCHCAGQPSYTPMHYDPMLLVWALSNASGYCSALFMCAARPHARYSACRACCAGTGALS
eukprot:3309445-Rhodomonas_salina.1